MKKNEIENLSIKRAGIILTSVAIGISLSASNVLIAKADVIENKEAVEEINTIDNDNEEMEQPIVEESEEINIQSIVMPEESEKIEWEKSTEKNILGGANYWNGFVLENVTSGIDFEGSMAVAGDFISERGMSINNGIDGASTEETNDISLLVGGNINIAGYGNVRGQTVVGESEGNIYNLTNITENETTNGKYVIKDSSKYFEAATNDLKAISLNLSLLEPNSVMKKEGNSYIFEGDSNLDTLIFNVDEVDFSSYDIIINCNANQKVLINFTNPNEVKFTNGGFVLNSNRDDNYLRNNTNNIIYNFISDQITMQSASLYGTFIAPNSNLVATNGNITGRLIINNLTANQGFELHLSANNTPIEEIKEPKKEESEPEEESKTEEKPEESKPDYTRKRQDESVVEVIIQDQAVPKEVNPDTGLNINTSNILSTSNTTAILGYVTTSLVRKRKK